MMRMFKLGMKDGKTYFVKSKNNLEDTIRSIADADWWITETVRLNGNELAIKVDEISYIEDVTDREW